MEYITDNKVLLQLYSSTLFLRIISYNKLCYSSSAIAVAVYCTSCGHFRDVIAGIKLTNELRIGV